MPALATPLTDTKIRTSKPRDKVYTLADGGGMYLEVAPSGSKVWRMAYRQQNGKSNRLTFGTYPEVSLAEARIKRAFARKQLSESIDPARHKREEKKKRATANALSFEIVAREWLSATAHERAASTQDKNTNWLEKNIFPHIGQFPIASVKSTDVLAALRFIQARGAFESAQKIKQICGQIFRFGVAGGYCEHDVTTTLRTTKPPRRHYAAITKPHEAGGLLRAIDGYVGHPFAVVALKLSPLVFVRPGELRAAEWSEIDFAAAEWNIPGVKMKMKTEHLVPLSRQALALLEQIKAITGGSKYVFPSIRTADRCMSENTVNAAIRNLGYSKDQMTAHGFRAMARTILDEILGERVDLIEHQLAHQVRDVHGRAYNRTSHLPARRQMMQRWADYLDELRIAIEA